MPVDFDATVLKANMESFGIDARYIPKDYAAFPVTGVFDEAYTETRVIDGALITTTTPVFGTRLIYFLNPPAQDDHMVIKGKAYIVREPRPDGHGGMKLMLNFDSDYIWP